MNTLILSMIILSIIAPGYSGLGIIAGIFVIYFCLANNTEKYYIRQKFKRWSWWDWRV